VFFAVQDDGPVQVRVDAAWAKRLQGVEAQPRRVAAQELEVTRYGGGVHAVGSTL
jgi:hypothetical protein